MKQTLVVISSLLLSVSAISLSAAGNPSSGKHLFEEKPSTCLSCHATGAKFNKASNLQQLEARVRKCDVSAKTNWYDDEIGDVTSYLNQQYYNF